jgi:hypothetical protein
MQNPQKPLTAASAATSTRMIILALPARMILVWIKPPAKYEMLAMLVPALFGSDGLSDHFGQLTIRQIATLICGSGIFGVCLDAW